MNSPQAICPVTERISSAIRVKVRNRMAVFAIANLKLHVSQNEKRNNEFDRHFVTKRKWLFTLAVSKIFHSVKSDNQETQFNVFELLTKIMFS